jgi:hypothetical protein
MQKYFQMLTLFCINKFSFKSLFRLDKLNSIKIQMEDIAKKLSVLKQGIPSELPKLPERDNSVPHAPNRIHNLTKEEQKVFKFFVKSQSLLLKMHSDIFQRNSMKLWHQNSTKNFKTMVTFTCIVLDQLNMK